VSLRDHRQQVCDQAAPRLHSARLALLAEDEQHAVAGNSTGLIPSLASWTGGTVRIGVTGLARAGKTAFLTSLAANLMAMGTGQPTLPALAARLGGRRLDVALAAAGASAVPRFDYGAHLDALAAEPAVWPARTGAVSLLVLDISISRAGLAGQLPPRHLRLEFLDYPGEWLLDLPLLRMSFSDWS
jgi:predicted YcjX-like family ATPase